MLPSQTQSLLCFVLAIVTNEPVVGGPDLDPTSKICPKLLSLLENGERVNVLVNFVGGTEEPLERAAMLRINDRGEKAKAIYESLSAHAEKSQDDLVHMLSTRSGGDGSVEFKKFWITNQMWVKGADLKLIRTIAEDSKVRKVKQVPVAQLIDEGGDVARYIPGIDPPQTTPNGTQWNIERIEAPKAWEELGGGRGEGVLVGILDSGVQASHEALRDNFLGDYGWFDPATHELEPYDGYGHGTHVAGVAVGSKGIGVAPGAKWSACNTYWLGSIPDKAMLECGEFFACPTLANGTNRDCTKAPNVINNSWRNPPGEIAEGVYGDYDGIIKTWHAMGIIPVFSIGNDNACTFVAYPGLHPDVIGVGNVNRENSTDGTDSSKGPTQDGRIKPDLAAPGERIYSATRGPFNETNLYETQSGTSMASPHVTGVVALLLSREKQLTYAQVKDYLLQNTDRESLKVPQKGNPPYIPRCGSVQNGSLVWPNNHYGYGLVNAYQVVKSQTAALAKNKHAKDMK